MNISSLNDFMYSLNENRYNICVYIQNQYDNQYMKLFIYSKLVIVSTDWLQLYTSASDFSRPRFTQFEIYHVYNHFRTILIYTH